MVSAKDDEPEWVKGYYRKGLKLCILAIGLSVAIAVIGGSLTGMFGLFFLLGLSPFIPFGLWMNRAVKPVREWRKAWLREHQIRAKEDVQPVNTQEKSEDSA